MSIRKTFKHKGVTTTVVVSDNDKRYKAIKKELKVLNNSYTAVGFPGDVGSDIKTIAATMEYGSTKKKIPARDFMRQTFDNKLNQESINKLLDRFLFRIYSGTLTVRTALSRLGEWYTGRIKNTIMTGVFTPLKLATIRRKGSSRPLVDTGRMKNAVTHREYIK